MVRADFPLEFHGALNRLESPGEKDGEEIDEIPIPSEIESESGEAEERAHEDVIGSQDDHRGKQEGEGGLEQGPQ